LKLSIIGNGFDIGHNLPTAFWDFRNYIGGTQPAFYSSLKRKLGPLRGGRIDRVK
jgi:hypothetical protein